jgi:exodeoxyribonuclease VII small subunit
MDKDVPEALSFEQAYLELQGIVEQLERGNLPLEDTLALYERGTALYRRCAALLKDAELRIRQLSADLELSEEHEPKGPEP